MNKKDKKIEKKANQTLLKHLGPLYSQDQGQQITDTFIADKDYVSYAVTINGHTRTLELKKSQRVEWLRFSDGTEGIQVDGISI